MSAPMIASEVRLKRLVLDNFRSCSSFELDADGHDVTIRGKNGSGKTTLLDAYTWLFTGKDSFGSTAIGVKQLEEDGEAVHGVEHRVSAELIVDGEPKAFSRSYAEKYTRKRGSAESEFTGHATGFATGRTLDTLVPCSAGAFDKAVKAFFPNDTFWLLTHPAHFSERLDWRERRALLLRACGDVSDAQVIDDNPALRPLRVLLASRSVEETKRASQEAEKRLNRELDTIPVRLDEVRRGLPPRPAEGLEELHARVEESDRAVAAIRATSPLAAHDAELARLKAEVARKEADFSQVLSRERREAEHRRLEAGYALKNARSALQSERDRLKRLESEAEAAAERLKRLESEAEAAAERLESAALAPIGEEPQFDDACPGCARPLEGEKLDIARKLHEAALESRRKDRAVVLDSLAHSSRHAAQLVARAHDEIAAKLAEREALMGGLPDLVETFEAAQNSLALLPPPEADFTIISAACGTAKTELQKAEVAAEEWAAKAPSDDSSREEIMRLDKAWSHARALIRQHEAHQAGIRRIVEIETERRRLADQYQAQAEVVRLCDEFAKAKVRALETRINLTFKYARFRMFREQINGGLAECCDTVYGGRPWGDLSHSERQNVGLDIIETLGGALGVRLPIWLDNAESVSRPIEVSAQFLRLVVDPDNDTPAVVLE
ncbi:MAG: AAA family ATPase [Patescibacteria group bacterium]|nr:AAA family ATPase [Patescibacteria group bacterium]